MWLWEKALSRRLIDRSADCLVAGYRYEFCAVKILRRCLTVIGNKSRIRFFYRSLVTRSVNSSLALTRRVKWFLKLLSLARIAWTPTFRELVRTSRTVLQNVRMQIIKKNFSLVEQSLRFAFHLFCKTVQMCIKIKQNTKIVVKCSFKQSCKTWMINNYNVNKVCVLFSIILRGW